MLSKKPSLPEKTNQKSDKRQAKNLAIFKKSLEKNFFAEVVIQNKLVANTKVENLIINIHCNYNLSEIVTYVSNGTWGNIHENEKPTPFIKAFNKLQNNNNKYTIDIEEFLIHFNDTTIIINKIYDNSIPDQLENILTQLANHYIYYTKGYTDIPYEIYIPIFEENIFIDNSIILDTKRTINTKEDFFNYWSLYFSYMDDAVVYDLKKRVDINASLCMLYS